MTRPDWPAIRLALVIRASGRCERCGCPLPNDFEVQHRRARGMGGTRRDDVHSLPNLLAFCPPCHDNVERHERADAFDLGYALRQEAVPVTEPVWLRGSRWALLNEDGTYTFLHLAAS